MIILLFCVIVYDNKGDDFVQWQPVEISKSDFHKREGATLAFSPDYGLALERERDWAWKKVKTKAKSINFHIMIPFIIFPGKMFSRSLERAQRQRRDVLHEIRSDLLESCCCFGFGILLSLIDFPRNFLERKVVSTVAVEESHLPCFRDPSKGSSDI